MRGRQHTTLSCSIIGQGSMGRSTSPDFSVVVSFFFAPQKNQKNRGFCSKIVQARELDTWVNEKKHAGARAGLIAGRAGCEPLIRS